ncbi:MAG: type IV pilin protein [Opitutales bacterium]
MHMKKGLQKKILGFTLVEIMIVVTIIGILASLAVPAFQRARWKALETSIRNNLRQVWGAAQQYMLENGVTSVKATDIVAWKPKTGVVKGTNEGYTSVIQQIAEENYDEIGIYVSDDSKQEGAITISTFTTNEMEGGDDQELKNAQGDSILTEDTQGLFIKVGTRWVKLRL